MERRGSGAHRGERGGWVGGGKIVRRGVGNAQAQERHGRRRMVTNWVVGANGEINIGTVETRRPTSPVRAVLVPKVAVESEYGSVGATREGLGGARAAPLTSMPSTIFSLRALFTGLFARAAARRPSSRVGHLNDLFFACDFARLSLS